MRPTINIYILIILLVIVSEGNAQKYTQGVYEFGLISLENSVDSPLDSSTITMIKDGVEREMAMKVYFKENRLTMEKVNAYGNTMKGIFDIESKKVYQFIDSTDPPTFTVDDMPDEMMSNKSLFPVDSTSIGEGKVLSEKIFGLDCKEYAINQEGVSMTLILTKDILVHDATNLSPMSSEYGSVVRISLLDQMGIRLTVGMKSFSPFIEDQNIFSIDTVGRENKTKLRDAMANVFEEMAEEEEETLKEYGTYETTSTNKDLIQKLVDQGALDKDDWDVSYALEEENSYDIPSILLMAKNASIGLPKMDRVEIKEVLYKNEMLTPTIERLIDLEDAEWNKIPEEYRYQAICLAAVKDHLNSKATRTRIVENLQRMKFGDFENNSIAQSYIEGNASLDELLNEVNVFQRLEEGVATSDDDIYGYIKSFYQVAFGPTDIEVAISRKNNMVTLNDGENNHLIDINSLKEEDYEKSDFDNGQIVYLDTTLISTNFYDQLINHVKQIGADNESGLAFNIFHLMPPFVREIDDYDYSEIVNACPLLSIPIEALYFQSFAKEEYDPVGALGTSFLYHPNASENEVKIGNFRIGSIDAGIDYLTSSQKHKFIDFLTENHSTFGMDKERLENTTSQIKTRLIAGSEELLQYLPNINITVSKIFDVTPKSQYSPSFDEENNDFKHAYSGLSRVFGDDFKPTNFSYDSEAHKVHFMYNGKNRTVDPGSRNMVRFIQENMKKTKSGKQIYPVSMFSVIEEQYYYLTPSQKEELSKLVPINF